MNATRSAVRRVPKAPWMTGLRGRIAALAALIAMLSTGLCAIAGAQALRAGFASHEAEHSAQEVLGVVRQMERTVEELAFEVDDYAGWTELYDQMPQPASDWSRINLTPGAQQGRLTSAFALFTDGRCVGRHRTEDHRIDEPSAGDPASTAALALIARRAPIGGFASLRGHPALVVARPIRRSDGSGDSAGVLVGVAYVATSALNRVHVAAGAITVQYAPTGVTGAVMTGMSEGSQWARAAVACLDGGHLQVTLRQPIETHQVALLHAQRAVLVSGVVGVVVSALLGVVLGLRWVRPLFLLAATCRQRVDHPERPLPPLGDLEEAEVLGAALDDLAAAEHRQREALGEALEREAATNAVQQRFLTQLGHEFGDPVRSLQAVIARISVDGRLTPEDAALAREGIAVLEERLLEVLGLASGLEEGGQTGRSQDASLYLVGIADALRQRAQRRGVSILVEAPVFDVEVDARLLSPVLVNLVANAVRFARTRVVLTAEPEGDLVRWDVIDDGPGLAPAIHRAFVEACQRGSVLPGTEGLGLGIAVVLANVRALGGRVDLTASSAEGTQVTVTIPQRSTGTASDRRTASAITALHRRRHG